MAVCFESRCSVGASNGWNIFLSDDEVAKSRCVVYLIDCQRREMLNFGKYAVCERLCGLTNLLNGFTQSIDVGAGAVSVNSA